MFSKFLLSSYSMQDWSHSPKHDRGHLTVRANRIIVRAMTFGTQPACGFHNTGPSKVSLGLVVGVSIDSNPHPGLAKYGQPQRCVHGTCSGSTPAAPSSLPGGATASIDRGQFLPGHTAASVVENAPSAGTDAIITSDDFRRVCRACTRCLGAAARMSLRAAML